MNTELKLPRLPGKAERHKVKAALVLAIAGFIIVVSVILFWGCKEKHPSSPVVISSR